MNNLLKRIFTSIPIFIIIYGAIINQHILILLLIVIGFFVMVEFYRLIKKIFKKQNNKIAILYLILIVYLSICFSQLYLFVTHNYNNKLIFIYLLLVCIMTDLGGYIFGKLFKGKKLIKISLNKTYSGLIGSYIFSNIIYFFYLKFNFSYSFIILTFFVCSIFKWRFIYFLF